MGLRVGQLAWPDRAKIGAHGPDHPEMSSGRALARWAGPGRGPRAFWRPLLLQSDKVWSISIILFHVTTFRSCYVILW